MSSLERISHIRNNYFSGARNLERASWASKQLPPSHEPPHTKSLRRTATILAMALASTSIVGMIDTVTAEEAEAAEICPPSSVQARREVKLSGVPDFGDQSKVLMAAYGVDNVSKIDRKIKEEATATDPESGRPCIPISLDGASPAAPEDTAPSADTSPPDSPETSMEPPTTQGVPDTPVTTVLQSSSTIRPPRYTTSTNFPPVTDAPGSDESDPAGTVAKVVVGAGATLGAGAYIRERMKLAREQRAAPPKPRLPIRPDICADDENKSRLYLPKFPGTWIQGAEVLQAFMDRIIPPQGGRTIVRGISYDEATPGEKTVVRRDVKNGVIVTEDRLGGYTDCFYVIDVDGVRSLYKIAPEGGLTRVDARAAATLDTPSKAPESPGAPDSGGGPDLGKLFAAIIIGGAVGLSEGANGGRSGGADAPAYCARMEARANIYTNSDLIAAGC